MLRKFVFALMIAGIGFPAVSVHSQDGAWTTPDPNVGAIFPDVLNAPDQSGTPTTLGELVGRQGVVVAFVRSTDWCPFCSVRIESASGAADLVPGGHTQTCVLGT